MADPAEAFALMAERIAKIDQTEFAGAVVVVPPGGGEIIAFLTTDPQPNQAQFYTSVMSRVEIAAAHAKDAEATAQGQPWMRR